MVLAIRPKNRALLMLLLEHRSRIVTREEIQNLLWGDLAVDPNSLSQIVLELRKVFRDHGDGSKFIKTIPKTGYQWVFQPVHVTEPETGKSRTTKTYSEPETSHSPEHRQNFRTLSAVVLALLFISAGAWFFFRSSDNPVLPPAANSVPTLLMLPFLNETNQKDLDWIEIGLMDLISRDMSLRAIHTVSSFKLAPLWKKGGLHFRTPIPQAELNKLLERFPCNFIIHTKFRLENNLVMFNFSIYEDGKLIETENIAVKNPLNAATEISRTLLSRLKIKANTTFGKSAFHKHAYINESFAKGLQWFYFGESSKALHYFDICLLQDPTWRMGRFFKALALLKLGSQPEALAITRDLLSKFKQSGNPETSVPQTVDTVSEGMLHNLLAEIYLGMRKLPEAEQQLDLAMKQVAHPGHRLQLLILAGNIYTLTGKFNKAVAVYDEALNLSKTLKSIDGEALVHLNLAQLYLRMRKDWKSTESHLLKANELARIFDNKSMQSFCLMQLGGQYADKDLPKAKAYLEQALQVKRELGEKRGIAISLDYLGDINMQLNHIDRSEKLLNEALELWKTIGDPYNQVNSLLLHVNLNLVRRDRLHALGFLEQAKAICEKQNDMEGLMLVYLGYWEVEFQAGNLDETARIFKKIDELLSQVPVYLVTSANCYRAADSYKRGNAQKALELLRECRSDMGTDSWTETHQSYFDVYERTVKTGTCEKLPNELNPLKHPG